MNKMNKRRITLIFLPLMAVLLTKEATAQTSSMPSLPQPAMQTRAAQYHLGDKDQILMNVNIWGYVQRPGQYVVPRNTDLVSLISFAGGPRDGANMSKVNIVRAGQLDQVALNGHGTNGNNGHSRVPILSVDVNKHLKTGQVSRIPVLKAGDTILIPQTFGSKFQSIIGLSSLVSFIAVMASVTVIIRELK